MRLYAVKAGSTTISAIATDGGGATSTNSCAVTVTPKPEPPKPTTPPRVIMVEETEYRMLETK